MNKYLKVGGIVLGAVLLIGILLNFGLNLWLKYGLPKYIKNNTDYAVQYENLGVDVWTGNISAKAIRIKTTSKKTNILKISGDIKALEVSRLGLYSAIFQHDINLNRLALEQPQLHILLPESQKQKQDKNWSLSLGQVLIEGGNIEIHQPKQKLASVKDLHLNIKNLKTSQNPNQELPFSFEDYQIRGKALEISPDEVYRFTMDDFSKDKNEDLHLVNFKLKPLMDYAQFTKKFPKKRNLFDVEIKEVQLKTLQFESQKIKLEEVVFTEPQLTLHTTNVAPEEKEKSFTYQVEMGNVQLQNAKINILKPNTKPLFSTASLTMNISKIFMDDQTAKGNIPFNYETFDIDAHQLAYYSNTEQVKVNHLKAQKNDLSLSQISVKPTARSPYQPEIQMNIDQLRFKAKYWAFEDNRLKLDIAQAYAGRVDAHIKAAAQSRQKQQDFSGIAMPLLIRRAEVKHANLTFEKDQKPLQIKGASFAVNDVEMNENTLNHQIPVKVGNFKLAVQSVDYKMNPYYRLKTQAITVENRQFAIHQFEMIPMVSRAQFIKMIPYEKDFYTITAKKIAGHGDWNLLTTAQPYINAENLLLSEVDANIFRSTIPKDDNSARPLYATMLRKIKLPLYIKQVDLKNSKLVYEEDTESSNGAGKIAFSSFNATLKNINSAKMKNKPTVVDIAVNAKFMNASPLIAYWQFDVRNQQDAFKIWGHLSDLPAVRINSFLLPYLKIKATGAIQRLDFNFNGNQQFLTGTMKMKHQELKIAFVDKDGKEKHKLLSGIINWVVTNDSKKYPDAVDIGKVEREPQRSFFNFFWKGLEAGLKKILI